MGFYDAFRRLFSFSSIYKRMFKKIKHKRSFYSIASLLSKPIQRTRRTSILYDELHTEIDILYSNIETKEYKEKLYDLGTKSLVTGATALNDLVDKRLRRWDKMHWLLPFLDGVIDSKGQKLSVSVLYEIFNDFLIPIISEYPLLKDHAKTIGNIIRTRVKKETSSNNSKKTIIAHVDLFLKSLP